MPSLAEATSAAVSGSPPDFAPEELVEAYRVMVTARVMDERCLTLQRQGRIGFYVPLQGQEAAQVGCAWALRPEDWVFPAYRELAVALVRKVPIPWIMDQFLGNSGDAEKGRQMPNHYGFRRYNFVAGSSPVGTQISQAVGAAMAAKFRKDPIVTVAFFGDGTTSANDFHAGLNFAGVFKTPTIFFCQNNQWAISYPREKQTRSATLAQKAEAYGFPGYLVDGMNIHEVFRAVSQARVRAISGEGPTMIEAQVYRMGPHSTSDDPRRYRTEAELTAWKERDPVARLKHELISQGVLTEDSDAEIWKSAKETVAAALKEGEATPPIEPATLFDDVFASRPATLEAQREEFLSFIREGILKP